MQGQRKKDELELNLLLNQVSTITDYQLEGLYEWCRKESRRRQAEKEERRGRIARYYGDAGQ